jgi:integrase
VPRAAGVFYDKRAGCWATNALGPMRTTKTGRRYRPRSYNRELAHPTKDRRAAEAWLSDELRKSTAEARPSRDPDLHAVIEWYLEAAEKDLAPETYDRRVEQLRRAADWPAPDHPQRLGLKRASAISADDIRPFLEAMLEAGNSESYVRRGLLMALKRVFSWATNEVTPDRLPGLPLASDPLLRKLRGNVPRRAHRDLDPLAVGRFIRWAWRRSCKMTGLNQRFGKIAVILLQALRDTGCRPKEMCVATWSEYRVLPDGWGMITLPTWKHKTGRKTNKERRIALSPSLVRRLEWIRGLEGRHPEHIFTHRRGSGAEDRGAPAEAGEPWTWIDAKGRQIGDSKPLRKWFFRIVKEARAEGVKLPEGFRLYFLRSSYSTEAQRKGIGRAMLAEAMGTSEAMLAAHYTDADESDVLGVARRAKARPGS